MQYVFILNKERGERTLALMQCSYFLLSPIGQKWNSYLGPKRENPCQSGEEKKMKEWVRIVCVCAYMRVCICEHVYTCSHDSMHVEARVYCNCLQQSLSLIPLTGVSHLNLLISQEWMARTVQGSFCLYLPSTGVIGAHCQAWCFCVDLGRLN